ncbi:UDP-N-acetylmuramoyl-L-alanine--D-glutamate ligase [Entomobacter blattae]|uniref:UDP-N-acetylmuramoylalanine--D-glutamate ligase n=1 Tax=Entomobacter blattae TaxID=2762277 RepID=A0A7H1NNR8_9PROT|nr:UDP-N-acetylmuramoyl-L-alanine--D-glutamate ligase [Entomobacter blattae]QNT77428.1 UDP-N-acetylmuramoylalanine--D-glutamate ligase [Entomobacter blattae]
MKSFSPTLFFGQRYAVLGLGRNGCAAVQALTQMGAFVQAWDDSPDHRKALENNLADKSISALLTLSPIQTLTGMDGLILSPGIPHHLPQPHPVAAMARESGIPILSDSELLYRAVRQSGSSAVFAGITGTNGKSTTTTLLTHLLQHHNIPAVAGGNLGPAALSLPLLDDQGVYVLEMSSYMLERVYDLRFHVACLLNLTPDHLDRHGHMDGYAAAKKRIFQNQNSHDLSLISQDDTSCLKITEELEKTSLSEIVKMTSSPRISAPLSTDGQKIYYEGQAVLSLQEAKTLPGLHNAQNAMAASLMAHRLGVPFPAIQKGLQTYPGLAHRQQMAGTVGSVHFINDSKATNADAASKALSCYNPLVWIAGGQSKAGGIESLVTFFPHIAKAFLIGQDAEILAQTLARHHVEFSLSGTLEQATQAAYAYASANAIATVLFSPACASFDQFKNFEERGERFVEIVSHMGLHPMKNVPLQPPDSL